MPRLPLGSEPSYREACDDDVGVETGVGALSRRALRRRQPTGSEAELDRAFAGLHYGAALVRRLMGDP